MVLQVICKLSLSKKECRQHVLKEAFKFDTIEVNESKRDEEKHAKFV